MGERACAPGGPAAGVSGCRPVLRPFWGHFRPYWSTLRSCNFYAVWSWAMSRHAKWREKRRLLESDTPRALGTRTETLASKMWKTRLFLGCICTKSVKVITSKNQQKVENFQIPARFWETNIVPTYKPRGGSPAIPEVPDSIPEPKKYDILFLGVKYLLSISVIIRCFAAPVYF